MGARPEGADPNPQFHEVWVLLGVFLGAGWWRNPDSSDVGAGCDAMRGAPPRGAWLPQKAHPSEPSTPKANKGAPPGGAPTPPFYLHAATLGLRLGAQPLAVAALGSVPAGHGLLGLRLPLHAAGGQELRLLLLLLLLRGLAALRHPHRRSPGRPPPRWPRCQHGGRR